MEKETRNKIELSLCCKDHPDTILQFSGENAANVGSFSLNAKLLIEPCRDCQSERKAITDAIELITKTQSKTQNKE